MPLDIDYDNLLPFPKRIPEKLRAIREQLKLTQGEIARRVGARNGVEIAAYEHDEDDLLAPCCGVTQRSRTFLSGTSLMMIAIYGLGIA